MVMGNKVEWQISSGSTNQTFKTNPNEHPIEIATQFIEKNFKKLVKAKRTLSIMMIMTDGNEIHVFPTDTVLANAGLYKQAEKFKTIREQYIKNNE